jgi:hypothetical protein
LDGGAIDDVVRGGEYPAITRIEYRVVHPPTIKQRALDFPPAAVVIAPEQEEPFACTDEREDGDRCTYLDRGVIASDRILAGGRANQRDALSAQARGARTDSKWGHEPETRYGNPAPAAYVELDLLVLRSEG